jgi:outer membrane immunogenic protein
MYIGGFAGGSWANVTFSPFGAPTSYRESGFLGGVYVGYDYELPDRFIVGARISVPLGAISQTAAVPFIPGETVKSQFQWGTAVNVIFGYDMGAWEPYMGLGAIFVDNKATVNLVGGASASDDELHPGVNVLAGLKYRVVTNWTVGAQYNYSRFASQTYNFPAPVGATGTGKFYQNSLVGTLEYHF